MNISLGLYDIFAHLVPGVLVIYIVNELLILLKLPSINIDRLTNPAYFVLFLISGYVLSNLLYLINNRLWYHHASYTVRKRALADVRERSAGLNICFQVNDLGPLIEALRIRNMLALREIDRFKVNSIMMRNLMMCLLLYAVYQIVTVFAFGEWLPALPVAVIALIFLPISHKMAQQFDRWYYRAVFHQALCYGTSLKTVLQNPNPAWKEVRAPRAKFSGRRQKT